MAGAQTDRVRREVRWFVDGDVSPGLRPRGHSRRRVDRYDLASLRPWASLKRRGRNGTVERKTRVGPVELTIFDGLIGFAETWAKAPSRSERTGRGSWLEVDKELWTDRELEIGTYRVGTHEGWTICIDLDRPVRLPTRDVLDSWAPILRQRGRSSSYAAWLGEHHRAAARGRAGDSRGTR